MNYQAANGRWVVWGSLLVSLLFQIMPLPEVVAAWRPNLLLLVLIYWAMALPHRYNILTAWLFGVMLDVLLGASLGIRALAFSIVVYVVVIHFQRLRNFPVWQQSILVFSLVGFQTLVIYVAEFILNDSTFGIHIFYPAVSSLVLWPWVFMILRRIRRHKKVR